MKEKGVDAGGGVFLAVLVPVLLWMIGAAAAGAADRERKDGRAGVPGDVPDRWTATLHRTGEYDWIRLASGEWLKGDIKVLRGDALEFDSDELGDPTFDWDRITDPLPDRNADVPEEDDFRFTVGISIEF